MTADAERFAVAAGIGVVLAVLLQASTGGPQELDRLLLRAVVPVVLGLVAGRFVVPSFVLLTISIALVLRVPGAEQTDVSTSLAAAAVTMAVGVGLGIGGGTALIAVAVVPITMLWLDLHDGEAVSVPLLAVTGLVVLTALVVLDRQRTGQSWAAAGARWRRAVLLVAVALPAMALAAQLVPRVQDEPDWGGGTSERWLTEPGDGDPSGAFTYVGFGDELDISDPVELDDDVVFRVTTDRATYWRVATFDRFDGERWAAGPPAPAVGTLGAAYAGTESPGGGSLADAPFAEITQTFTVERPLAGQLPIAWEPVYVHVWDQFPDIGPDGTVALDRPLTRGEQYVTVSAMPLASAPTLQRAKGPVPRELLERYAVDPDTSPRVRAAAAEATAGATNDYDRVVALERWIGEQVEYDRDIDPMPAGTDVVDHFLFESRVGFCEQIGTSLVVMARSLGLPARLVVGFVPGERDAGDGAWVVRGRDAHAWAEVWFPGIGWQAFDPTASVPLAADSVVDDSVQRDLVVPLLVGAAIVLALGAAGLAARFTLRAVRRRRRPEPAAPAERIIAARLVDLADRAGTDVAPPRTLREIAVDLGRRVDVPDAVRVAGVADRAAFARSPLAEAERARCLAVLDVIEGRLGAQDEQESIEHPALVRAQSGRRAAKRSRPG